MAIPRSIERMARTPARRTLSTYLALVLGLSLAGCQTSPHAAQERFARLFVAKPRDTQKIEATKELLDRTPPQERPGVVAEKVTEFPVCAPEIAYAAARIAQTPDEAAALTLACVQALPSSATDADSPAPPGAPQPPPPPDSASRVFGAAMAATSGDQRQAIEQVASANAELAALSETRPVKRPDVAFQWPPPTASIGLPIDTSNLPDLTGPLPQAAGDLAQFLRRGGHSNIRFICLPREALSQHGRAFDADGCVLLTDWRPVDDNGKPIARSGLFGWLAPRPAIGHFQSVAFFLIPQGLSFRTLPPSPEPTLLMSTYEEADWTTSCLERTPPADLSTMGEASGESTRRQLVAVAYVFKQRSRASNGTLVRIRNVEPGEIVKRLMTPNRL